MQNIKKKRKPKLMTIDIFKSSVIRAFVKLNPLYMIKNPVIFIVEIGFVATLLFFFFSGSQDVQGAEFKQFNLIVSILLFLTVLFANFAEAIAEGRGKAQAEALRRTQKDTKARLVLPGGDEMIINSSELKKDYVVLVRAGEIIPNDGEVIEGIASVDESAITGESAPVIRESGGDFSSVTGGTMVVSDWIKIRITALPGESFLDKMILLVEGATRKKTPKEIALNKLLVRFTLAFLLILVTMYAIGIHFGVSLPFSILIAVLVCLAPTTIGGLLSAIGIAGMDRVTRFNVIALSGKAIETCGDIDTVILDKTGTITYGNRKAWDFYPVNGTDKQELIKYAVACSLKDDTPEGRSIVELGSRLSQESLNLDTYYTADYIPFTARTCMSGIDIHEHSADGKTASELSQPDVIRIRKGSYSAITKYIETQGEKTEDFKIPAELKTQVDEIARLGGTPIVVCINKKILGVIYLKDTIKDGLIRRFARLHKIGIKSIMCTGDNPLTAATIAGEAGVGGFIAECKPEDKIELIKQEQAQGKTVAMTGDGTNDAPALAQADVALVMNSGTIAAKEAANMVDLDSDPTKLLEVIEISKQLLVTRNALAIFNFANYIPFLFAIIPALFMLLFPEVQILNIMNLSTPFSAVLSTLIFNALIILLLIPIALRGVKYRPMNKSKTLARNIFIYGILGISVPFAGIKLIDLVVGRMLVILGLS